MAAMRLSALLALVACAAGAAFGGQRSLAGHLAEEQRRSDVSAPPGGWRLFAIPADDADEASLPRGPKVVAWSEGRPSVSVLLGTIEALPHKLLTRLRGAKESGVDADDGSKLGVGQEDITLGELFFILGLLLMALCVCGCFCLCCSTIMGAAVVYNVRLTLLLEERDRLEKRMPRHMKEKVAHPDFKRLCDDLFNEVDTAGTGELQATQLKNAVMKAYGQELQNERFFIELFDSDKSGTVNQDEFFQIMKFYEFIAYEKEWGKQPDPESGYEHADPNANEPYQTQPVAETKALEAD